MKAIFLLSFLFVLAACKNEAAEEVKTPQQAASDSANFTSVAYPDSAQNLGVLTMGESVQVTFNFKNTGSKPLYIISAEPSCGCTVADFPKEPVAPGSAGKIVAVFDTNKSSVGNFTKVVTVTTNTQPDANVLTFSGEVIAKGNDAKDPQPIPNKQ